MTTNASVQFHIRFVNEKHNELAASLDQFVNALVSENLEHKKKIAEATRSKASDLRASISQQDRPSWLDQLVSNLNLFIADKWKQPDIINYLINNVPSIKNHKWVFENPDKIGFDFDAIFEHYKSNSRLPELFDEIIKILEEIQNSEEVDSVAMMSALGKVISTLKKNRDGSYFSINGAWSFLISFLQNYMWAELAKIPVLGTAMESLEKTIKETNEEMFKVHSEAQEEMKNTVENEVKGLKKKTKFDFVEYNKSGAMLPYLESESTIKTSA